MASFQSVNLEAENIAAQIRQEIDNDMTDVTVGVNETELTNEDDYDEDDIEDDDDQQQEEDQEDEIEEEEDEQDDDQDGEEEDDPEEEEEIAFDSNDDGYGN